MQGLHWQLHCRRQIATDLALSANLLTVQPDFWDLASDAASGVKATT